MTNKTIEYCFLKKAAEIFIQDLKKIDELMNDKIFGQNEKLEIMGYLIAIKEDIEMMEKNYLQ